MKKDRNCGASYPIYPTYPGVMPQGMMGMPMPGVMPINPYQTQTVTQTTTSSSTIEQQLSNLNSQINNLERRVSSLESLIGNTNSYNNSNYQVM